METRNTETCRPELQLTHFGAAAWRITDGETTLYVDPYFSRLRTVKVFGTSFPPPSNDRRPVYGYDDLLPSDTAMIDQHVTGQAGLRPEARREGQADEDAG